MPEIITAITPQKKRKDRVNVYINEAYRFSLPLWAAGGLRQGEAIAPERIDELKSLDEKERAYQRSVAYLARRPRSRLEITRYLDNKGFTRQTIEAVMDRLEMQGYINDADFARMWIDSRLRHRPRGIFALQYELRQKGVSEKIIQTALQDYDEHAAGWSAISRKLTAWQGLPEIKRRQKVYAFLNQRGFSSEVCRDICDAAILQP